MENRNILTTLIPSIILIGMAAMSRLLPHPPNFTPIGGIALFAGSYIPGPAGIIIPALALLLSDLVLGFHNTMAYVYGAFFLIFLLGKLVRKNKSFKPLVSTAFGASFMFFVITNFGVWQATQMYSKDIHGLLQSYIMGLPFFGATVSGDLFYTLILFYGYRYIDNVLTRVYHAHRTTG